jgi:hypothetical protein
MIFIIRLSVNIMVLQLKMPVQTKTVSEILITTFIIQSEAAVMINVKFVDGCNRGSMPMEIQMAFC